MLAVYGIQPDNLDDETVYRLLPSYLRRTHHEREQLAILVVNQLAQAMNGKGRSASTPSGTKPIKRVSPSQLQASMKARSVTLTD